MVLQEDVARLEMIVHKKKFSKRVGYVLCCSGSRKGMRDPSFTLNS
jgi:hypothetical protein